MYQALCWAQQMKKTSKATSLPSRSSESSGRKVANHHYDTVGQCRDSHMDRMHGNPKAEHCGWFVLEAWLEMEMSETVLNLQSSIIYSSFIHSTNMSLIFVS